MSDIDSREFGRLEAEVAQLRDMVSEIRTDMKEMKRNWNEARGGFKVLLGIAAVLGGLLSQGMSWALGKFH